MINGINLNDASQNQITFQPSINTTAEFKISNSTYSAEYGRSSGSIVNVATRSGTNSFHGEAFDYLRNNYFDARNYFNRKPARQNSFIRNNSGGAFSGPIWKDHTFFFLSYEGLRQHQALLFNGNVLSPAQRAAFATSPAGPAYAQLINLIPAGNNATGTVFQGSSPGPVKIDQFSGDLFHTLRQRQSPLLLRLAAGCAHRAQPAGQHHSRLWRSPHGAPADRHPERGPHFLPQYRE